MKIRKFYESNDINVYYKIFIDGSFEKFDIALSKLGIKNDLFNEWGIDDYNELFDDNLEIFKNKIVYLSITEDKFGIPCKGEPCGKSFGVRKTFNELQNANTTKDLKYGGEIHIQDYEIDANKYNI